MPKKAEPLGLLQATLGEAPFWNPFRQELSVVDIERGEHHTFEHFEGAWKKKSTLAMGKRLGAAVPCDDGSYLYCQADGIWKASALRSPVLLAALPESQETHRINDAKLGPDGALWFGVMHLDALPGQGSLWKLLVDGTLLRVLGGLTIPNGMDWYQEEFWFVDGPAEKVSCYRMKGGSSLVLDGVIEVSQTPDGLCIDADGNLWLALWGGGRVLKMSRTGEVLAEVLVSAPNVTSVAFIGPDYRHLAITSATHMLSKKDLELHPDSGDIFISESIGQGVAPNFHFGD